MRYEDGGLREGGSDGCSTDVYVATIDGTIEGTSWQILYAHATGTSVAFKPYVDYVFHSLSVRFTDAKCADRVDVQQDLVAIYNVQTYVLTYGAGMGGMLEGVTDFHTVANRVDNESVFA